MLFLYAGELHTHVEEERVNMCVRIFFTKPSDEYMLHIAIHYAICEARVDVGSIEEREIA